MNPVHVEAARSIKNAVENKAFVSKKLTCANLCVQQSARTMRSLTQDVRRHTPARCYQLS